MIIYFNYNQIYKHPMDQPQLSLNQILNTLKQKSHKNSQTQLCYKPQSDISNNYKNQSQQDEQLLIRQSDLRSILQKMLYQIQQKNILLQEKQKQNKDCLRLLHKHQLLIQQYKFNLQNKQKIYKKNMEEMEYMLNKQKKQKEILILDYNWAKNKNKEQLKQIQKIKNNNMKQLISNQAQYKIAANEPSYKIISKKKQQSNEKKLLITPGKQDGKSLDNYIMKYSQSVDSGISQTNNINSNNRQLQKLRLNTNEVEKDGIINCNKNQASTMIMNKNSISQKDRLINMLGQKCIALESQLQKLMKRYLGQIVITTNNSNSNKDSNSRQFLPSQPESISQFSQYSSKEGLVRKGSDVQLSGAFKIQEEDF